MLGPQLINNLVGVLSKFHLEKIALVADIEAMFYQIMVAPKDKNALQFLWRLSDDLLETPRVYTKAVHLFGTTSSLSCASFRLK